MGYPSTLHRPTDGQLELRKGAEEDQMVKNVIRAYSASRILLEPAILWTQVAGKEELWASIPTVFQGGIVGNLVNAVRIRRDNKNGVLNTIMPDVKS